MAIEKNGYKVATKAEKEAIFHELEQCCVAEVRSRPLPQHSIVALAYFDKKPGFSWVNYVNPVAWLKNELSEGRSVVVAREAPSPGYTGPSTDWGMAGVAATNKPEDLLKATMLFELEGVTETLVLTSATINWPVIGLALGGVGVAGYFLLKRKR